MLGGADLTYRERALRAEAENADLRATLAEYERRDRREREDGAALSARMALAARMRPHLTPNERHFVGKIARLFEHLIAHPGQVVAGWKLLEVLATHDPADLQTDSLVRVTICVARKVLRAIDLGDAIVTCWGRGYELRADRVEALKAWCEGRA